MRCKHELYCRFLQTPCVRKNGLKIYNWKGELKPLEKQRIWHWSRHKYKKERLIHSCAVKFKLMFPSHGNWQRIPYKSRKWSKKGYKRAIHRWRPPVAIHMRRCFISPGIKGLHLKTTLIPFRCHRMGKYQMKWGNLTLPRCWVWSHARSPLLAAVNFKLYFGEWSGDSSFTWRWLCTNPVSGH